MIDLSDPAAGDEVVGRDLLQVLRPAALREAYGQRSANRHPSFGLIGEVISPFRMIRFIFRSMSSEGIADSSALVYGWYCF